MHKLGYGLIQCFDHNATEQLTTYLPESKLTLGFLQNISFSSKIIWFTSIVANRVKLTYCISGVELFCVFVSRYIQLKTPCRCRQVIMKHTYVNQFAFTFYASFTDRMKSRKFFLLDEWFHRLFRRKKCHETIP